MITQTTLFLAFLIYFCEFHLNCLVSLSNLREADTVALLVAHSNEDRLHFSSTELSL